MKTQYVCQECGHGQARWSGQCEGCSQWNTLEEGIVPGKSKNRLSAVAASVPVQPATTTKLSTHTPAQYPRFASGSEEFDRVLGGGLVPGSMVVLSAEPGAGKSTLSSRIIDHLASTGKKVLYMAGEESGSQMRLRCDRMGLTNSDSVDVTDTVELNQLAALLEGGYDFAVIDSMQTLYDSTMSAAPGTPSVLKQIGHVLMRIAKGSNVTMLLIGHVTKDGVLAGPRHVEHMVDVVLHMEGDRSQGLRVLRSMKNRFGATDEVGIFEMVEDGLIDVSDPSLLLMNEHSEQVPGSVICPTLEGTRPVFVEVQALAQPVAFQGAPPARRPRGIDKARLDMLLAVLQRHSRMPLKLHGKDIYVNISNGLRIEEPAIDLAVCVAVASAVTGRPVKKDLAAWGEVSLLGESRSVRGDGKRRNEAIRLGLKPLAPEPKKRPVPLGVVLRDALETTAARDDLSEEERPNREAMIAPPPLAERA